MWLASSEKGLAGGGAAVGAIAAGGRAEEVPLEGVVLDGREVAVARDVYRARHRILGRPVALKVLTARR